MSPAYTVTPEYHSDEPGAQPELVGFNATPGRDTRVNPDQLYEDWTPDEHGRFHHAYAGDVPTDLIDDDNLDWHKASEDIFDSEAYYGALAEIPGVPESLEWAPSHFSKEYIDAYHEALENDDLETVNEMLEKILEAYSEFGPGDIDDSSTEEHDDNITDDWTEEDFDTYNRTVEYLSQQSPDASVVDDWNELGMEALRQGDETASAIYALTAQFHAGDIGMDEAIDIVVSQYPKDDVLRVLADFIDG